MTSQQLNGKSGVQQRARGTSLEKKVHFSHVDTAAAAAAAAATTEAARYWHSRTGVVQKQSFGSKYIIKKGFLEGGYVACD
jgi:hypothetical protein